MRPKKHWICDVKGCGRASRSNGLCRAHYHRWRRTGNTQSSKPIKKREKHGMHETKIYAVWSTMLSRCRNPMDRGYQWYGARGISVCEKWCNSFLIFHHEMGDPPGPKYEIDRINNDGNYEIENCRWVLHKENGRHTRETKLDCEKAKAIRQSKLPQRKLAKLYKVSESCISSVKLGKSWK